MQLNMEKGSMWKWLLQLVDIHYSRYKSGKRDAAAIIKNTNGSPTKVTKIKIIVNA